ncbi:hypothetical protein Z043_126187, partial [Scleropages formosus]
KSLVEPSSSSAADGVLEQSMRPGTCDISHKASKQPCHDSVTAEAQNFKEKFQCIQCGKSFSRLSALKKHQHVHSGDLKKHQVVHSGEKPFRCDKCPKSFSRAGDLKQHKVVHSGEKPFRCDKCPKSFSRA